MEGQQQEADVKATVSANDQPPPADPKEDNNAEEEDRDRVDLLVSGGRFPASRSRLVQGSTVFHEMYELCSSTPPEVVAGEGGGHEELQIPNVDASPEDFACFLAMVQQPDRPYIHAASFEADQQRALTLVKLADRFDCPRLVEECDRRLAQCSVELDPFHMLLLADRLQLPRTTA
jgi:hypothetical protein